MNQFISDMVYFLIMMTIATIGSMSLALAVVVGVYDLLQYGTLVTCGSALIYIFIRNVWV